jgi:hypothetical protein
MSVLLRLALYRRALYRGSSVYSHMTQKNNRDSDLFDTEQVIQEI